MSFLFGDKPSPVAAPTKAPAAGPSRKELAAAEARTRERLQKQRGRAATVVTGPQGVIGDDSTGIASKVLLGG